MTRIQVGGDRTTICDGLCNEDERQQKIDDPNLIQVYTDLRESADKITTYSEVRRGFLDRLAIEDDNGEVT